MIFHKHEKNYDGLNFSVKNNTIVVGGGLASLDVVKIVMIEIVKMQLFLKKGIAARVGGTHTGIDMLIGQADKAWEIWQKN